MNLKKIRGKGAEQYIRQDSDPGQWRCTGKGHYLAMFHDDGRYFTRTGRYAPDGTLVLTTYGHWTEGEASYIVSVRLRMEEIDSKAEKERRSN